MLSSENENLKSELEKSHQESKDFKKKYLNLKSKAIDNL